MTPLSPRERVRRALAHKEADRIPIHDSLWNTTVSHSDHTVPNNVSYAQYCRVIDLVHKYGGYDSCAAT